MRRIDAHHHLWMYSEAEYGWIGEDMAGIRRDFLVPELRETLRGSGVNAAVTVQARQSLEETRWLLDLAKDEPVMAGVVGWAPLISPQIGAIVEELAAAPKLVGLRHVLQGEPERGWMLRPEFERGLQELERRGLCYDLLILSHQLGEAIELVDRHPGLSFVLDHVAKPRIKAGELEPWSRDLRELARRPNVTCKISGMVTEADLQRWTEAQLSPYIETCLEAFGPGRLMFGSDWPVCEAACSHARWVQVLERQTSALSANERAAFWGGTATRIYGLDRR